MDKLSNAIQLCHTDDNKTIRKKASLVKPSINQMHWMQMEYTAFIHFGVNTFTDSEWGHGNEDPAIFNPIEFDGNEMVSILHKADMKMVILTCKHHDGFCLWPSKYTNHSVKSSPYKNGKGDIVKELSDACKNHGLKFGVYLSPWDMHEEKYGKGEAYNDYYINQLTELLTQYGEISDVWLDGACGEGPNGKVQEYDWARIYRTVRELAPNATITGVAPDARWCGNESGKCRASEWNALPIPNTDEFLPEYSSKTAFAFAEHNIKPPYLCTNDDLGSVIKLKERAQNGDRLYWYPAQVNYSIRPGWFYHEYEDLSVKTVDFLFNTYLLSVGGNTQMLLNIPPDKRGKIHEVDASRLEILGNVIRKTFEKNLLDNATITSSCGENIQAVLHNDTNFYKASQEKNIAIEIELKEDCVFDIFMIKENVANGQKIEEVKLEIYQENQWKEISTATTIGYKRFLRCDGTKAKKIRFTIVDSRDVPEILQLGMYQLPAMLDEPIIERDENGLVSLTTKYEAEIRYTTDKSEPNEYSLLYTKPFLFKNSGTINAKAFYSNEIQKNAIQTSFHSSGKVFGILKTDFKILGTSGGEENGFEASNILISDNSKYVKSTDQHYTVSVDMGKEYDVIGFLYQPVTEGYDFNYNCASCRIYLSNDGKNWENVDGEILFGNIYHNPILYTVNFKESHKARYLKFEAVTGIRSEKIAFAEIGVLTN